MTVNHVGYTNPTFEQLQSTRPCPTWSTGTFQPSARDRLVDEFLSSYFSVDVRTGQEHLYKATIAITEKLIPKPTIPEGFSFDGLMYPTIPMGGNCENFALRPEFVKDAVKFLKAEFVVVTDIKGMQMTFDGLDFANSIDSGGKFEWKGRPGRWTVPPGVSLKIAVEHGEWVAYDPEGKRVPMD